MFILFFIISGRISSARDLLKTPHCEVCIVVANTRIGGTEPAEQMRCVLKCKMNALLCTIRRLSVLARQLCFCSVPIKFITIRFLIRCLQVFDTEFPRCHDGVDNP